eukprot:1159695-Pelagomonas_calceolata.AAC.10
MGYPVLRAAPLMNKLRVPVHVWTVVAFHLKQASLSLNQQSIISNLCLVCRAGPSDGDLLFQPTPLMCKLYVPVYA